MKMLLQLNTKILCQQNKKNTIEESNIRTKKTKTKKNKENIRRKGRIKRINMKEEEKQKLREK